jgi:hypothetical protein
MPSVYKRINQGYIDADREAQKDVVRKQFRFVAQQNERNLEPTLLDNITKFNIDKYFDDFRDEVQRIIDNYLQGKQASTTLSIVLSYNLLTNYIKNYAKMGKLDQREKSDIQDKFNTLKPLVQQVINIATKGKSKNLSQLMELYDNIDSYHYVPVGIDRDIQKEYDDKIKAFEEKEREVLPFSEIIKDFKDTYDEYFIEDKDGVAPYDEISKKEKEELDSDFLQFKKLEKQYIMSSERLKPQIYEKLNKIYQKFLYNAYGAPEVVEEEEEEEEEGEEGEEKEGELFQPEITEEDRALEEYMKSAEYRRDLKEEEIEQKRIFLKEKLQRIGKNRGTLSRVEIQQSKDEANRIVLEKKLREIREMEPVGIEEAAEFEEPVEEAAEFEEPIEEEEKLSKKELRRQEKKIKSEKRQEQKRLREEQKEKREEEKKQIGRAHV